MFGDYVSFKLVGRCIVGNNVLDKLCVSGVAHKAIIWGSFVGCSDGVVAFVNVHARIGECGGCEVDKLVYLDSCVVRELLG